MLTMYLLMLSDVNECSYSRGGCAQLCFNFPGGYNCSCLQGYTLQSDKKSCQGTCVCRSVQCPVLMTTRDKTVNESTLTNLLCSSKLMRVAERTWQFNIIIPPPKKTQLTKQNKKQKQKQNKQRKDKLGKVY